MLELSESTAQVVGMKQGEKYDASRLQERHRDHGWFIAFAPAEQPKIAVAILVENGGHGGGTAGPIARKVFDYYLLGKRPVPVSDTPAPPKPAPMPASAVSAVAPAASEDEHD